VKGGRGGKARRRETGGEREEREGEGVDLPDQCQTAPYAPDLCMHLLLWGCVLYRVTQKARQRYLCQILTDL